jgi:PAS domain S-box-containing protein/putative nucleotidyltransferase with HDIG domain
MEENLRESEEKYSSVVENSIDGIIVLQKGIIKFFNQAVLNLIGYNLEELIDREFENLLSPEYRKLIMNRYQARLAGKDVPSLYEMEIIRKDGISVPIEVSNTTITYRGEKATLSFIRNITERKQAEDELRESEAKYRAVLEQSVDNIFLVDLETKKILESNVSLRNLLGYSADEMKKLTVYDFVARPKDEMKKKLEQLQKEDKTVIRERKYLRKDGSLVDVEMVRNLITFGNKKVLCVVSRDISERKQAEENLKNAKDELQMIMDSVPATIFYKDTEGRIIRANKTMANSLKLSIKDIVGKASEELFSKEQAEKMRKDDQEVIVSGKPKRDIIHPYTTPDGIRWAITDKMPYKDKEGKVTGIIGLAKDITVQRKVEQKLKLTYQKLKKTMNASIETMSKILEAKDPYTAGHQQRVSQLATAIAKELNLSQDKIEGIRIASLIHDIGKIGLPTEILSKPTKLIDIEFSLIKNHSQIGYDILKSIEFPWPVAEIVFQHHEKIDGSGYPNNLKGDEILLEAKIIGVADVVEAMSSHRPYRPALGIDKALEEISQNREILYDPDVVDVCLKLFGEKSFKFEP